MMKSAAGARVTQRAPAALPRAKHDGAGDRHQQEHARELECEQVIP